jgi:hypothetical protein
MVNILAYGWRVSRHYNGMNCEFSVRSHKCLKMDFEFISGWKPPAGLSGSNLIPGRPIHDDGEGNPLCPI